LLWIDAKPESDRDGLIEFSRRHFFQGRDGISQIVGFGAVHLLDGGAITFAAVLLHVFVQFWRALRLSCLKFSYPLGQRDDESRGFFSIVKGNFVLIKTAVMKPHVIYRLSITAAALFGLSTFAYARPMDFGEVSLLVRAREPESSIMNDVNQRKLLHALSSDQENVLKKQGASNSLIQSLRSSSLVVSKEDAAAFEAEREKQTASRTRRESSDWDASDNVRVFDVALGHPINLSQWGGIDYELAFYSYRCAGEDIVEPVYIDPIGTVTTVSRNIASNAQSEEEAFGGFDHNAYRRQRFMPYDNDGHRFTAYDARRDLKDDRYNLSDSVSISSRSVSRPLAIDWSSPVTIKGVPYALYPVYGAGGVSLYFISVSSTSVRLAVSTTRM
jgi:hypothetical protein